MKNRQIEDRTYVVCWCLFAVYLLSLAYFLFFAEATGRTFGERTYQYNLIPFHEIRRFLIYRRQLGFAAVALNLVGNVLAFVPFGLFLPLLVKRVRSLAKTLLLGNLIKNELMQARNWPMGATLSIAMLLFTFAFIGIYKRVTGEKTLGGLK